MEDIESCPGSCCRITLLMGAVCDSTNDTFDVVQSGCVVWFGRN